MIHVGGSRSLWVAPPLGGGPEGDKESGRSNHEEHTGMQRLHLASASAPTMTSFDNRL